LTEFLEPSEHQIELGGEGMKSQLQTLNRELCWRGIRLEMSEQSVPIARAELAEEAALSALVLPLIDLTDVSDPN
jgi:hypothetical protein